MKGIAQKFVCGRLALRAFWRGRFALAFLLCCTVTFAQSPEYRAKAGFLAAFPNFVEWPNDAFSSEKAPLLVCVFGDFSFGTSLAELTRASLIHGRRIEVRWTHKEQELRSCQIVFVSRSAAGNYGKILKGLQGASALTVGETDEFLENGGAIRFLVDEDRLQFEVNMAATEAARLRISSTMLAHAHQVRRPEAAKVSLANHTDPARN